MVGFQFRWRQTFWSNVNSPDVQWNIQTWQNDSWQVEAVEDLQLGFVAALADGVQNLDQLLEVEEPVTVGVHQTERPLNLDEKNINFCVSPKLIQSTISLTKSLQELSLNSWSDL